jgi:hypothetical protein
MRELAFRRRPLTEPKLERHWGVIEIFRGFFSSGLSGAVSACFDFLRWNDPQQSLPIEHKNPLDDISNVAGDELGSQFRRSKRVNARSAVVVEGLLSDGTAFIDMTYALVLSSHGCLVTVSRPIELGKQVTLRNPATNFREQCRVVYVARVTGDETRVGLGFESEAPEFWGVGRLPTVGGGWSDAS